MWMWVPDLENLTFSIPIFCLISHPSVYYFWKKSTQFWPMGAFYNYLPKIHPICVIWAPPSPMKTSRSLYQILRKSAPKGWHIPCQCENPHPRVKCMLSYICGSWFYYINSPQFARWLNAICVQLLSHNRKHVIHLTVNIHSKTPHVVTVLWLDSDNVVIILSPTSALQNRVSVPPWFLHISDCL